MNKLKNFSAVISIACFCCFFWSCNKNTDAQKKPTPVMQINISPTVAENTSDFAMKFFSVLQQTQSHTENIFVSPLSLHMDLGMLLNGANGNTYTQLQHALNLNGLSITDINQAYQTLLQELPKADNLVDLTLANSMWYKNNFSVKTDYINTLKNYFQAAVTAAPFDASTVDAINKWASDNTKEKIKNVVTAEDVNDAIMFLLNALYFKGDWASPFGKNNTKSQTFSLEDGSTKQVQMMWQENAFTYTSNATYSMLRMPYGNGQFSMTVILPKQENKIEDVMNHFTVNDWNNFQQDTFKTSVQVGFPRFQIPKYNVDLMPVLKTMGVTDVFNENLSDLSKISTVEKLFVNLVKQFTYLKVDETGTEAAAVTVIGMMTTSLPSIPIFICDHPFGMIISENTSNTILFMGRIMNPDSQ
jgi:serpin B